MNTLPDFSEVFADAYSALTQDQTVQVYGLWGSVKGAFLSGLNQKSDRDVLILCPSPHIS